MTWYPDGLCCIANVQVMFYKAGVPVKEVAEGFVIPRLPRSNIGHAVALIGSLIMPHNIYLHSALVQSRQLRRQDDQHRQEALVYYGIESGLSLLVSWVLKEGGARGREEGVVQAEAVQRGAHLWAVQLHLACVQLARLVARERLSNAAG